MKTFTEILESKKTDEELEKFFDSNSCQFVCSVAGKYGGAFTHAGFFLNSVGRLCFWTIVQNPLETKGPVVCMRRARKFNEIECFGFNIYVKDWLDFGKFLHMSERELIPDSLFGQPTVF